MRAIRTAIVKSQLACDFEAAFDLLLFQLARSVFTNGYHDDALDIRVVETPDRPAMRVNDDAFSTVNVGEKHLEIDRAAQKLDWTGLSDDEAFAELRALPEQDKRTLFASCVARTLKGQLAFEPKARAEVEATVARLDIDFAAAVRGNRDQVWTADLLWSRLRKDRILAIARGTLGETWAQAEAKQKKADIAKAMEDAFAHGDGIPAGVTADGRAAGIAWTPPGFRAFDTGTVDDEGAASDEGTTAPEPQPTAADTPLGDAPEDDGDDADGGADPSGADSDTSQSGDPEAGAPADNVADPAPAEAQQPMNTGVQSVVESIEAPAVADRRAVALASAVNADATPPVAASALSANIPETLAPLGITVGCQGRRETRPKGGAKHCHRGLRGEMVRGGRDEAGGGVSRKRREGVARAQFPAGGDAERSGCSVLFSRAAVVEAEALAVHFQDMDVMGQSVEQRPGQALGTERLGPFVEGKIRGDQNRGALVALRDELEQQLRSGLRQRDEAQLVNDQQLVVGELLLQPQQPSFIARLHELMHERRGGDEAHRQPPLARGQSQSLGHVSLPGAARSQSDDVLAPLDPFTSGELEHLDLAE